MARDNSIEIERCKGALDVLFTLREEFAQWLDEAEDASKREALENVFNHVGNIENEYRRRLYEAAGG